MSTQSKSSQLTPEVQILLKTLSDFEGLLSQFQFKFQTHSEASLQRFASLPKETQGQITSGLQSYLQFLTFCSQSGFNLRFDRDLIRTFLKQMNFIYDESLIEQINDGSVIEIYNPENSQIFRNLRMLDICSYSLLDLLTYDPFELYDRSENVIGQLVDLSAKLAARPYDLSPVDLHYVPKHLVREIFSPRKVAVEVQFRIAYPLYKWPQEYAGVLLIEDALPVSADSSSVGFI